MSKAKTLPTLFCTFLQIGAFTFGGGYAMIPVIQKEAVEKHKWIDQDDLLDIIAVAESTPGPIAINSATFVGYRVAGFLGALCATIGVVLPSFLIIAALSGILTAFQDAPAVQYAFRGIQAGVLALIAKALLTMYKQCPKGAVAYVLMGGSFLAVAVFKAPVIAVIAICAVIGIISAEVARRKKA